jgi:hypothetical protein
LDAPWKDASQYNPDFFNSLWKDASQYKPGFFNNLWNGAEWWDTLMRGAQGVRIVRVQHDWDDQ